MAKGIDQLRKGLQALAKDDPAALAALGEEFPTLRGQPAAQPSSFDWTRDPFEIAQELSGSVITVHASGLELRVSDAQGWREMDPKRAEEYRIASRTPGMIHIFPTKRYRPKEEGAAKAERYNILGVVATSSTYPHGLVTINGLYQGRTLIGGSSVFAPLGIPEVDNANLVFFAPGVRTFAPAESRIQALRAMYNVGTFDPDRVRGYKIPARGL